jgi:hypothetical protein
MNELGGTVVSSELERVVVRENRFPPSFLHPLAFSSFDPANDAHLALHPVAQISLKLVL